MKQRPFVPRHPGGKRWYGDGWYRVPKPLPKPAPPKEKQDAK